MFDDLRNPDRPKQDVIYLTLFNVNFLSIMQNVKPQKLLSTPVCFISYIFFFIKTYVFALWIYCFKNV